MRPYPRTLRLYPRTEPPKTAQQWAFERKQTPELTPGGVNRPPRSRPRPALRGGVHGPSGPFDPRPLSCYNFDRAFWVCQGALGWGAASAKESPQGAIWDGRGCDPGGANVLAARGVPAANGGGKREGPLRAEERPRRWRDRAFTSRGFLFRNVTVCLRTLERSPHILQLCPESFGGQEAAIFIHQPQRSSGAFFGTRVTGNVWCSTATWTASPVPSLAGMLAVTVFHYLGSALSGKKPNCHTIRRSTLS